MFFNNKQINLILNELRKNNKEVNHILVSFFRKLPENVMEILKECQSIEYEGDDFEVSAYFAYNCIQIEIFYNDEYLRIELCPITHEQIKEIPFDQEHDIFLDNEDDHLDSPAFFNVIYNPDLDLYDTSIDTPDIGYYIVEQKDGFHLISQAMDDAGIHNTKIDIEDFIIEPTEDVKRMLEEQAKEQATEQENPLIIEHSRRAHRPRYDF